MPRFVPYGYVVDSLLKDRNQRNAIKKSNKTGIQLFGTCLVCGKGINDEKDSVPVVLGYIKGIDDVIYLDADYPRNTNEEPNNNMGEFPVGKTCYRNLEKAIPQWQNDYPDLNVQ